ISAECHPLRRTLHPFPTHRSSDLTVPTDDDCQLDLSRLRAAITSRTRAIVTISPNNPTGAVYPEAALRAVNELCQEYGIYHISRSEEHTSELQSREKLVCRLLLEK